MGAHSASVERSLIHQDGAALVHGAVRGGGQFVKAGAESSGAGGGGEAGMERGELQGVHTEFSESGQLLIQEEGAGQVDQARRLRTLFQERVLPAQVRVQRHNDLLAQRVDGRVGDLGELLPEVRVEQARRVLQRRGGGVVSHGAHRLLAGAHHGLDDVLHLLFGVAVKHLAGLHVGRGLRAQAPVDVTEPRLQMDQASLHPVRVGAAGGEAALDGIVAKNETAVGVDGDHLARPQAARFDDVFNGQAEQANFGGHHDHALAGDLIAGGPETVAVKRGGGDNAVREGDGGGAVPGLGEAGVILVEPAQLRVNVGHVLPGFWDQHHHGVEWITSRVDEEVERLVQRGAVGAAVGDAGRELGELVVPPGSGQLPIARLHPIAVADEGVDLAVVGEVAERLRQLPVGQRVGGEALMEQGQGRDRACILEVGVEAVELVRDHQALVDHGAGGHGNDVAVKRALAVGALGAAAGQVDGPLEVIALQAGRTHHEKLFDPGQRLERRGAQDGGIRRNHAPADHLQAAAVSGLLQNGPSGGAVRLSGRQEGHGDDQIVAVLERAIESRCVLFQQLEGDLDRESHAVARHGVGVDGAAMGEIADRPDRQRHDLVRARAVDVGDEADAAGVVRNLGVIEPRLSRGLPRHSAPSPVKVRPVSAYPQRGEERRIGEPVTPSQSRLARGRPRWNTKTRCLARSGVVSIADAGSPLAQRCEDFPMRSPGCRECYRVFQSIE